jgi:hypothetical protein
VFVLTQVMVVALPISVRSDLGVSVFVLGFTIANLHLPFLKLLFAVICIVLFYELSLLHYHHAPATGGF